MASENNTVDCYVFLVNYELVKYRNVLGRIKDTISSVVQGEEENPENMSSLDSKPVLRV